MKKYIRQVATFLVAVVAFMLCAEAFMRHIPNAYRYKEQWLGANGENVGTLVLGNSHDYYGIRPSLLGKDAFSVACVSQRFDQDLYLLKRYFNYCPNLERVIINVDCSNLFDPPLDEDEAYRLAYYHLYMGMPLKKSQWRGYVELAYIAAAREKFKNYVKSGSLPFDSLGWGNNYKSGNRQQSSFTIWNIKRRVEELKCRNYVHYEHNVKVLCDIAGFCQSHGLELIVVSMPVVQAFYKNMGEKERALLKKAINRVRDFPAVSYYDFTTDLALAEGDFFNCDHLADTGADKFSRQLADSIKP